MAEVNCSACDDLRQTAPNFVINGLGDTECASLQNDTGLDPSSGHDNCTDLNNMNDCLIGVMKDEVNSYQICDWKSYMKRLADNLWTMFKGMICAICGMWGKITCTYNSLVNLVNYLAASTAGVAFVRYFRDLGADDNVPYWTRVSNGFSPDPLEIYMDSSGASGGSKPADRDYVVLISNCTNYVGFAELHGYVYYYSSSEDDSTAAKRSSIRSHKAQHPVVTTANSAQNFQNFSWTTSGAVLLRKGEHIKVGFYVSTVNKGDAYDSDNTRPKVRLHQFILTWIPVNVSEALDPSDIMEC